MTSTSNKRRKQVKFNETEVGHFLYVYAPIQYYLLMEYSKAVARHEINHHTIETIALNSDNPTFTTARFRRALIAYRRFGMRPLKKTVWSLKDVLYYARHSHYVHEEIRRSAV